MATPFLNHFVQLCLNGIALTPSQDDTTGDGTTSTVLLIGELLRQAELYLVDGLHPRLVAEGFEKAKDIALDELTKFALAAGADGTPDRERLIQVARTALRTKIHQQVHPTLMQKYFIGFFYNIFTFPAGTEKSFSENFL